MVFHITIDSENKSDEPTVLFDDDYCEIIIHDLDAPIEDQLRLATEDINIYKEIGVVPELKDLSEIDYHYIIDNIEGVTIGAHSKEKEYVKNHSFLLNKPVELSEPLELNDKSYNWVVNRYSDFPDLRVRTEYDYSYVSLENYKNVIHSIHNFVDTIKSNNLSPLEQVMLAYDLVRNRIYISESENQHWTKSRDLSQVMLGDEIVCAGYAAVMTCVLDLLEIENKHWQLDGINVDYGHVRNSVKIDDDKYNIHGIYFLDCTYDSKMDVDDNKFVNWYKCFAMNYRENHKLDRGKFTSPGFISKDARKRMDEFIETEDINCVTPEDCKAFRTATTPFFDYWSFMELVIIKMINADPHKEFGCIKPVDFNELKETTNQFYSYIDVDQIDIKNMIDAFITVRQIEVELNPDLYHPTEEDAKEFVKTVSRGRYSENEAIVVATLFGEESDLYKSMNEPFDYIESKGLPKRNDNKSMK